MILFCFPLSLCLVVDNKTETHATIWRIPTQDDGSDNDGAILDDSSSSAQSLEVLCRLDNSHGNIAR